MAVMLNPVLVYAVQDYVARSPRQGLPLSNCFFVDPVKKKYITRVTI